LADSYIIPDNSLRTAFSFSSIAARPAGIQGVDDLQGGLQLGGSFVYVEGSAMSLHDN